MARHTRLFAPLLAGALAVSAAIALPAAGAHTHGASTHGASTHAEGHGAHTQGDGHGSHGTVVSLLRAAFATAPYRDLAKANAAGYVDIVTDVNGFTCIAQPGQGAMGVHYVNGGLVDDKVEVTKPELVVYEPGRNGKLKLVALEYLAFQEAWDATHDKPPSLFGQEFMLTPGPNRYGPDAFYALHAWIWKFNPSGTFAMWNPRVICP